MTILPEAKGKTALVTSASRGIGRALASRIADYLKCSKPRSFANTIIAVPRYSALTCSLNGDDSQAASSATKGEAATKGVVHDILVRNADRNLHRSARTLHRDGRGIRLTQDDQSFRWRVRLLRGWRVDHSNMIENVFSVFKRGMIGVYQHCGESHSPLLG